MSEEELVKKYVLSRVPHVKMERAQLELDPRYGKYRAWYYTTNDCEGNGSYLAAKTREGAIKEMEEELERFEEKKRRPPGPFVSM